MFDSIQNSAGHEKYAGADHASDNDEEEVAEAESTNEVSHVVEREWAL